MLSSLAFSVCLVAILSAWLVGLIGWLGRQAVQAGVIWFTCLIPPILVSSVILLSDNRQGDYRVAIEGLRFAVNSVGEIRVGGGPRDHLRVEELPEEFLLLRYSTKGVEVSLGGRSERERSFGVVRVQGRRPFHNAVPIRADALIRLGNARTLRFNPDTESFGEVGRADFAPIPRRFNTFELPVFGELQVPVYARLRAELEMHPLRYHAAVPEQPELEDPSGGPYGSFLCWDGLWERFFGFSLNRTPLFGTPYVVLLDPTVSVVTASQTVDFQRTVASIASGESIHLALFRVDYEDHRITPHAPSRTQERRSFTVRFVDGFVNVVFDTPFFVRLLRQDVQNAANRRTDERAAVLSIANQDFIGSLPAESLVVEAPFVGEPVATQLFSRIALSPESSSIRVTSLDGVRQYNLGDAFALGADSALLVRISQMGRPVAVLLMMAIAAVMGTVGALRVRSEFVAFVLLSGLECLLAVRFLVAWQAAYLDPAAASTAWQASAAFVALPFALQLAIARYRGVAAPVWPLHACVIVATLSAIAATVGIGSGMLAAAIALTLVSPFLLAALFRMLDRLLALTTGHCLITALILAVALVLLRVVSFVALGWKERATLGGVAVALSIVFVPATLAAFSLLWTERQRPRTVAAYWGLLLALCLFVPWIVKDVGAALIFPLPILLLFAAPLVPRLRPLKALAAMPMLVFRRRSRQAAVQWRVKVLLALPMLVALLVHLFLPVLPSRRWDDSDLARAKASAHEAEALIRQRLVSANHMRFWALAAPEALRQAGTRQAESLAIVMETLHRYSSRGLFGVGYLGIPIAPALRSTHLDDNVSAVHGLGTFGWAGASLFLMIVCCMGLAPFAQQRGGRIDARRAFGLMIIWTFLAAALYMFAANAQILLFTGKNVYLMAADSGSDLLESLILLMLALWAFK